VLLKIEFRESNSSGLLKIEFRESNSSGLLKIEFRESNSSPNLASFERKLCGFSVRERRRGRPRPQIEFGFRAGFRAGFMARVSRMMNVFTSQPMPTRLDPLQQSYFFRPLLDHQSVSFSWIRIQTNLDSKALGSS